MELREEVRRRSSPQVLLFSLIFMVKQMNEWILLLISCESSGKWADVWTCGCEGTSSSSSQMLLEPETSFSLVVDVQPTLVDSKIKQLEQVIYL